MLYFSNKKSLNKRYFLDDDDDDDDDDDGDMLFSFIEMDFCN